MTYKYFKNSAGEIFGFLEDGTQDQVISDDLLPLTPSEVDQIMSPQNYMSEDQKAELALKAMPALKRRQFRLTLVMNGYDLKQIESLIDGIEDPIQRTIAQIEWQDATDFERTNPTLLMMADMLSLDVDAVNELWEYGLAL